MMKREQRYNFEVCAIWVNLDLPISKDTMYAYAGASVRALSETNVGFEKILPFRDRYYGIPEKAAGSLYCEHVPPKGA